MPFSVSLPDGVRIQSDSPQEPEDFSSDEENEVIRALYEYRLSRNTIREQQGFRDTPRRGNFSIVVFGSAIMLAYETANIVYVSVADQTQSAVIALASLAILVTAIVVPYF